MAADRFGFGLEVLDTFCSLHPGQATAQLWIANAGLPELLASFGSLLLLLSVLAREAEGRQETEVATWQGRFEKLTKRWMLSEVNDSAKTFSFWRGERFRK